MKNIIKNAFSFYHIVESIFAEFIVIFIYF